MDPELIVLVITIIIFAIAFLVGLYQYKNRKYLFGLFLTLGYLSGMLWAIFFLFYEIYRHTYYFRVFFSYFYFMMPIIMSFCLIIALDYISRDSIDIKKMTLFTALGSSLLTFYFLYYYNPIIGDIFANFNVGFTYLVAFIWLGYTIKIYLRTPPKLIKYSRLNLIGGIFIGILTPIGVYTQIPPYSNYLFVSIGLFFSAVAFMKEPKLAGILPFRVFNLTIIDAISGNSIFSHDWDKKEGLMNDSLFSSLLQAISAILNEAIRKGNVREIYLDEAVIILKRSKKYPVAYVLITSKSSKTLRHALDSFAEKFDTRFSKYFTDMSNLEVYLPAYEIIHDCFPFVPEYD